MLTVILFTQQLHHSDTLMLKLPSAIVCMTLIIYFSFRYSTDVIKILGHTGMDVLAKIFGLITLALGIQFIVTGIRIDFRRAGESEDAVVNPMIECSCDRSVRTREELMETVSRFF